MTPHQWKLIIVGALAFLLGNVGIYLGYLTYLYLTGALHTND